MHHDVTLLWVRHPEPTAFPAELLATFNLGAGSERPTSSDRIWEIPPLHRGARHRLLLVEPRSWQSLHDAFASCLATLLVERLQRERESGRKVSDPVVAVIPAHWGAPIDVLRLFATRFDIALTAWDAEPTNGSVPAPWSTDTYVTDYTSVLHDASAVASIIGALPRQGDRDSQGRSLLLWIVGHAQTGAIQKRFRNAPAAAAIDVSFFPQKCAQHAFLALARKPLGGYDMLDPCRLFRLWTEISAFCRIRVVNTIHFLAHHWQLKPDELSAYAKYFLGNEANVDVLAEPVELHA